MKVLKTIILTILLLLLAILFSGAGHGTFVPAQIIYPYTMIIAKLQFEIGILGLLLALIEVPVYSYIWYNKPNFKYYIMGLHILGVLISFFIKSEIFN